MSTFKAGRLRAAANTSLGGDENEPNLKMAERHDWALFRSSKDSNRRRASRRISCAALS